MSETNELQAHCYNLTEELKMAKKKPEELRDIDECKKKINRILDEYGCTLISADEWHSVLIMDTDTQETCAALE